MEVNYVFKNSSNIEGFAYYESKEYTLFNLIVLFKNGTGYFYKDASKDTLIALENTESVGRTFRSLVMNILEYKKIDSDFNDKVVKKILDKLKELSGTFQLPDFVDEYKIIVIQND